MIIHVRSACLALNTKQSFYDRVKDMMPESKGSSAENNCGYIQKLIRQQAVSGTGNSRQSSKARDASCLSCNRK